MTSQNLLNEIADLNASLEKKVAFDESIKVKTNNLIRAAYAHLSQTGYPLDQVFLKMLAEFITKLKQRKEIQVELNNNEVYKKLATVVERYPNFEKAMQELKEKVVTFFDDIQEQPKELAGYVRLLKHYFPKIKALEGLNQREEKIVSDCESQLKKIVEFIEKLNDEKNYAAKRIALDNPIKEVLLAQALLIENDLYKVFLDFYANATKLENILVGKGAKQTIFADKTDANYFGSQFIKAMQYLTKIPILVEADPVKKYLALLPQDSQLNQYFRQAVENNPKFVSAANEYGRTQTLAEFIGNYAGQPDAMLSRMTYGELQYLLTDSKGKQGGGTQIVELSNGKLLQNMPGQQFVDVAVMQALQKSHPGLIVFNEHLKLLPGVSVALPPGRANLLSDISILKINYAYKQFTLGKLSAEKLTKLVSDELKASSPNNAENFKLKEDNLIRIFLNRIKGGKDKHEKSEAIEKLKANLNTVQKNSKNTLPVLKIFKDNTNVYNKLFDLDAATLKNINDDFLKFRSGNITESVFIKKLTDKIGAFESPAIEGQIKKTLREIKATAEVYSAKSISDKALYTFEVACDAVMQEFNYLMEKYAKKPQMIHVIAQLMMVSGLPHTAEGITATAVKLSAQLDPLLQHDLGQLCKRISLLKEIETKQIKQLLTSLALESKTADRNKASDKRENLAAIAVITNPLAFSKLAGLETAVHASELKELADAINKHMSGETNNNLNLTWNIKKTFPAITSDSLTAITNEIERQRIARSIMANADTRVKVIAQQMVQIISADTNIALDKGKAEAVISNLNNLAKHELKISRFINGAAEILAHTFDKKVKKGIVEAYQEDIQQRLATDQGYQKVATAQNKAEALNKELQQNEKQATQLNNTLKKSSSILRALKQLVSSKGHEAKLDKTKVGEISDLFKNITKLSETITLLHCQDQNNKTLGASGKNDLVFEKRWLEDVRNLKGDMAKLERNTLAELKQIRDTYKQEFKTLQKQQLGAIKQANGSKKLKFKLKQVAKVEASEEALVLLKGTKVAGLVTLIGILQPLKGIASESFCSELEALRRELMQDTQGVQKHFNENKGPVDALLGRKTEKVTWDTALEVIKQQHESINPGAGSTHQMEAPKFK